MIVPYPNILQAAFFGKKNQAETQLIGEPLGGSTSDRTPQSKRCFNFAITDSIELISANIGTLYVSAVRMDESLDTDISIVYDTDRYKVTKSVAEKVFNIKVWNDNTATDEEKKAYFHDTIPSNLQSWMKCDEGSVQIAYSCINSYQWSIVSNDLGSFHYSGNDIPFSWQNTVGYGFKPAIQEDFDTTGITHSTSTNTGAKVRTKTKNKTASGISRILYVRGELDANDDDLELLNGDVSGYYVDHVLSIMDVKSYIITEVGGIQVPNGAYRIEYESNCDVEIKVIDRSVSVAINSILNANASSTITSDATNVYKESSSPYRYRIAAIKHYYNNEATTSQKTEVDNAIPHYATFTDYYSQLLVVDATPDSKLINSEFVLTEISVFSGGDRVIAANEFIANDTVTTGRAFNGYSIPLVESIVIRPTNANKVGIESYGYVRTKDIIINSEVFIPRNESNLSKDVLGNELSNKGYSLPQVPITDNAGTDEYDLSVIDDDLPSDYSYGDALHSKMLVDEDLNIILIGKEPINNHEALKRYTNTI